MIAFFILSHKFRRIAAEKAPAGSLPLRNLPFSLAELCVRYDMLCAVLESTTSVSTPS